MVTHDQTIHVIADQPAAAEPDVTVVAHDETEKRLARQIQCGRQLAQFHEAAHVRRHNGSPPVVKIHGEVDANFRGQERLDVRLEILRAHDLARLFRIAEANHNFCRLAFLSVVGHQIVNPRNNFGIMIHPVKFFVNRLTRALSADEYTGDPEINQLFVGVVSV